jgi:hypothetical protein
MDCLNCFLRPAFCQYSVATEFLGILDRVEGRNIFAVYSLSDRHLDTHQFSGEFDMHQFDSELDMLQSDLEMWKLEGHCHGVARLL